MQKEQTSFTQQKIESVNNPIQQGIIGFLCLTIFPLIYLIGKTLTALF